MTEEAEASVETEGNEPSIEDRARQLGWKPKDEFRGSDDQWTDAETFIRRGEEELPILRENVRKLSSQLSEHDLTIKDMRKAFEMERKADRKRLQDEFDAKMRAAVEDGDVDAYDRHQRDKAAALKSFEEEEKPQKQESQIDPAVSRFMSDNSEWYGKNTRMTAYADAVSAEIQQRNPLMSVQENLSAVLEEVKNTFPDQFDEEGGRTFSSVTPGRRNMNGRKAKSKTYEAMPKEYREACDRCVKVGLSSKEAYVENYWATEGSAQ